MDDKDNNIPVKSPSELFKETGENLKNRQANDPSKKTLMGMLGMLAEEYSKANAANEARKSPAQIAHDEELAAQKNIQFQKERALKKANIISTLFKDWIKRDTWLIFDEAVFLRMGKPPQEPTFFDSKTELHALAISCAGDSLKVLNLKEKPNLWRIQPFEWVCWLKQKNEYIHPQLVEMLFPKEDLKPNIKTAKAIQSRETHKRDRQKALKAFAEQTENLARNKNIAWDSRAIPVTKLDFLAVFSKLNPVFKKITVGMLDNDNKVIGLSFKRGTKSNKNNILKIIYKSS